MTHIVDSRCVLSVRNLNASTRYYVDVLGFRRDDVDAEGWAFLSRDSFKIMLGECADETTAHELGNHGWFARLLVEGLDEFYREISSRGAEIVAEPADRRYGLRELVVRTLDGHRIMFAERISPPITAAEIPAFPLRRSPEGPDR